MATDRIQKILARVGFASRRGIEAWIVAGRIRVNGELAVLGQRVASGDVLSLDGKRIDWECVPGPTEMLLYNKPLGQICSHADPGGRPTVYDVLPKPSWGKWISVGRLDVNSEGLLLLTNDGDIAHRLMHPSHSILRHYLVRLSASVTAEQLRALKRGVCLEDGMARFEQIWPQRGSERHPWYKVQVSEGRNRLVRRLWESQAVMVSRLIRLRFGDWVLPKALPAGRFQAVAARDMPS